jgi:PIN domain nuclease of toxin-antitoxin system
MASVVLDALAVIALLIGEAGAESVAPYIGDGMISAVNLQEVTKALLRGGVSLGVAREMMDELHLDIRPHRQEEAFAPVALGER